MLFGGKDMEDFAGQLEEMQTKQREKVMRGKGASSLSLAVQALSFSLSLARCLLWLVSLLLSLREERGNYALIGVTHQRAIIILGRLSTQQLKKCYSTG